MNHADKKQQPGRGCCLIKVIIKIIVTQVFNVIFSLKLNDCLST